MKMNVWEDTTEDLQVIVPEDNKKRLYFALVFCDLKKNANTCRGLLEKILWAWARSHTPERICDYVSCSKPVGSVISQVGWGCTTHVDRISSPALQEGSLGFWILTRDFHSTNKWPICEHLPLQSGLILVSVILGL